jgi:hypothetical protein
MAIKDLMQNSGLLFLVRVISLNLTGARGKADTKGHIKKHVKFTQAKTEATREKARVNLVRQREPDVTYIEILKFVIWFVQFYSYLPTFPRAKSAEREPRVTR